MFPLYSLKSIENNLNMESVDDKIQAAIHPKFTKNLQVQAVMIKMILMVRLIFFLFMGCWVQAWFFNKFKFYL